MSSSGNRRFEKLDSAAEKRGGAIKALWQLAKFTAVSCVASIIQLSLVNILYYSLRGWVSPLPPLLAGIFSADAVGAGNDNWGYVLPFFVSNLAANVYGYIQNKKTTFKSDAPKYCFAIYLALMVCLILFSTWLQGVVVNALERAGSTFFAALAPTVAAACAGTLQLIVLFPIEKFVLLKERKES